MAPDTPSPIFVHRLHLRNILSFGGSNKRALELGPLNLIIGANGSGKSNLMEAVRLMRAAPKEMDEVTRHGGGIDEWLFKGEKRQQASIGWEIDRPPMGLLHSIRFKSVGQAFSIEHESISDAMNPGPFYVFLKGRGQFANSGDDGILPLGAIEADRSVLAQRRDPGLYPEITWLAQQYEKIRIYQEWTFGRKAVFREPQRADMRNDFLAEDFSNLGLYLNRLKTRFPTAKRQILDRLKDLYEGIQDFEVLVEGGSVQVFFIERDFAIPASRLSDGTLRYLCLLAILCDPEPPPLICIEEPELGLHPDILPKIAELLRSAATRTQLIVTTHSDILVDAMTDTPEVVVVCSKVDGETRMERLDPAALEEWLEKYRLGELWTRGEIGGTRW